MRAVVKYKQEDGNTEVREVPVPEIGPEDVLIKTAYIGICGSDPHMFHNHVSYPMAIPLILGHEFSGIIERVGDKVEGWKPGDRVTAETHARFCGRCVMCRTNNYRFCRERKGYGFGIDGAFAEYVAAPQRILHRIPDNLSLKDASCVEPLCVAYNVAVVKTPVKAADSVVVIGPGPIGLLCAKMAAVSGAADVVVVGGPGDEARLDAAFRFGATAVVRHGEDPMKAAEGMNEGYGADVVVDAAGPAATLKLALEMVRPDGMVNKIAWGPAPVDFSLDRIIQKGIHLQGCFSHSWEIWDKCLHLMDSGAVDLSAIISHELPLEEWREGFRLVESREGMKVVLKP